MASVELDRSFFPLSKDHEPSLDAGRIWGRKLGGWLEWGDLRERRRVVLLAEASSEIVSTGDLVAHFREASTLSKPFHEKSAQNGFERLGKDWQRKGAKPNGDTFDLEILTASSR